MNENIENKNPSSKEEYEQKKQDNKEQKENTGKKLTIPTSKIIWTIVILGIIGLIVWGALQPKIEKIEPVFLEGITELGEVFPIQKVSHIGIREAHDEYNSNPPTSGPHFAKAPLPGFYQKEFKDEEALHGLEHGYIWISYTSAVSKETIELFRRIYQQNSGSVMVSPREGNDSPIVLASWGRKLKLETYDESTIFTYIKLHKNQSPEPFAK